MLFTLTFVKLFVMRCKLFCRLSNGSSLNSLNSNSSSLAVVSYNCSLFDNLSCDSLRISCLSSLVAAARYECYAAKNSKREKYFLHFL